jgi:hypothetical protein
MSVAVIMDLPNGNQQRYEQVIANVFPEDKLPEGWQMHFAGPIEGGWRVVNASCRRKRSSRHSRMTDSALPSNKPGKATSFRSSRSFLSTS